MCILCLQQDQRALNTLCPFGLFAAAGVSQEGRYQIPVQFLRSVEARKPAVPSVLRCSQSSSRFYSLSPAIQRFQWFHC